MGTSFPQWTRKRWSWAVFTYYLLHLPLVFLPVQWLSSLPFSARWGFLVYFGASYLGLASAVWIISGKLHPAFPLIVLVPLLSLHFHRQLPVSLQAGFSALATVLILTFVGWWLRDAAIRHDTQQTDIVAIQ